MTVETPAQARETIFTRDFTLVFLANLANFLGFYLLMATLPLYVAHYVGREWMVGLILGVFGITGVVVRPLIGRLSDLRGGKVWMLAGAAVLLGAMLLFTRAHGAPSLFLLRVLQGIGWATFGTAASALIALIAPARRRGEAMGYFGISTNVAMAVAPAVGVLIVGAHARYTELFLASAGLVLLAGACALPVGNRRAEAHTPAAGLQGYVLRSALFPSLLAGISTLTYASVVFFLPQYTEHFRLGNAGLFFTVLAIVLVLTRGPLGWLSDRVGRAWVVGPGLLISAAGAALLALWPTPIMLLVAAAIYGIGTAAVQPTLMAMATDGAGPAQRGAAMGTYTTAFDLGIGVGASLWGWIIGAADRYQLMFALAAGMCVIGVMVLAVGSKAKRLSEAGKAFPLPE